MSNIPSIAMIPSAYKSGKLYSVLPSDGSGDFNFARTSEATRVNQNGLIETVGSNVPRIDYTDGGCPSLLLEPQRTNLVTYSEDFTVGGWIPVGSPNIELNNTISPDGTLNATKITRGTNTVVLRLITPPILNTEHTFSIYAKKGNNNNIELDIGDELPSSFTLTDEWKRYEVTSTPTSNNHVDIALPLSTSGDYIYIWGAQLEVGSYLTSYIPTNGSQVTRSAETCNNAGNSNVFNDSEGVLFAEISFPSQTTSSNLRIAISDGTTNNRILIQNVGSIANRLQFYLISNGGTSTDFYTNLSDITSFNKIAFKYKENDFSVWINGIKVLIDTSGITFSDGTLTELAFDGGDGAFPFYGNIKQIQYFDKALTDAELQALTQV